MASINDIMSDLVSAEQLTQLTTLLNNSGNLNALVTQSTVPQTAPTTVTSGAIPVTSGLTFITIADTQAYTLANGTYEGQRKTIRCTATSGSPAGTVTPATASGFSTLGFNAAEDFAILEWHAGGWRISSSVSVTVS